MTKIDELIKAIKAGNDDFYSIRDSRRIRNNSS